MIAALLPVKRFDQSKQRLSDVLPPPDRACLAQSMFDDVWAALRQACIAPGGIDRLLVISAEPYVLSCCRQAGVEYFEEDGQVSHSDSVIRGTRWALELGVTTLLSVPIDTPAVTSSEILELVSLRQAHPVVIVPSSDGTGTNALLRTPPDAIDPHFGPGSRKRHVEEAVARGHSHAVVRFPGLCDDIDTLEDLESFAAAGHNCRTAVLARELLERVNARRGRETLCR
jgi:2-phospho-L-lactate/phosphoenolpyruvate guanylyltransferase